MIVQACILKLPLGPTYDKLTFQAAISDDESPPATLTPHPPKVLIIITIYIF